MLKLDKKKKEDGIKIGTVTRDMMDWQVFSLLALLVQSTNTGTKVQIQEDGIKIGTVTRDMMDWQVLKYVCMYLSSCKLDKKKLI